MARTTAPLVQAVIEGYNANISLVGPIRTAHSLMNYVVSKDTAGLLTTDLKLEVETYLAAHFYSQAERAYESKSTGRSSGTFEGRTDMGLRNSHYGQQAIALDVSGTLASISDGKRTLGVHWLGTAEDSPRPDEEYI